MARLKSLLRILVDLLFGFDFFISYSHSDGFAYPGELTKRLEQLGFKVFLDSRVYVAGDDLKIATRRRIRMSKKLIVIARPSALKSHWVLKEVEECLLAGRTPIVIDVNRTIEDAAPTSEIKQRLQDKLHLRENLPSIDAPPSGTTVTDLVKSFDSTRQDTLRQRAVAAAAGVLAILAGLATWQFFVANQEREEAERQRDIAVSHELATKAQLLRLQDANQIDTSLRLVVESLKKSQKVGAANVESKQIFRDVVDVIARPFHEFEAESELGETTFSPKGTHLAIAQTDGRVIILRERDWGELHTVNHPTEVTSLRFAPDGKLIVSVDLSEIIVTMVESGEEVLRTGNLVGANDVHISADGKELLLIVPSPDEGGRTSRSQTWTMYRQEIGDSEFKPTLLVKNAKSVAVSGNGTAVSWHEGYPDRRTTVTTIAGSTDPFVQVIEDDDYAYLGIALSQGGRWLARLFRYDTETSYVEIFDTKKTEVQRRYLPLGDERTVAIVSFDHDRTLAIRAGAFVRVLDLRGTDQLTEKANIRFDNADRFDMSADGRYFAAISDELVRVWSIEDSDNPRRMLHNSKVRGLSFAPIFGDLITTSEKVAYAWNATTAWKPDGFDGGKPKGPISPDGRYEVQRRRDRLTLHRSGTFQSIRTFNTTSLARSHLGLRFTPNGELLVGGNQKGIIRFWQISDGQPKELAGKLRGEPLAFSPNGTMLASRVNEADNRRKNVIVVWDIETGKPLARHTGRFPFGAFQLANTGSFLVSRDFSDELPVIWVWDIGKDEVINDDNILAATTVDDDVFIVRKEGDQATIQSLGSGKIRGTIPTQADRFYLDQNGRWLAAARGADIVVWSIEDQAPAATIVLQHSPKAIGFSHDGQYLATISTQAVEVWKLTSGGVQQDRIIFQDPIGDPEVGLIGYYVAFSEDDRFVMAMNDEGKVDRVWMWRPSDLIAEACSYVPQLQCGKEE